jgi:hypothetical protein
MEASVKRFLVLAVLLPLFACGDDDPTGLDVDLNGTWRFSYTNMTGTYIGVTVSCSVTQVDFTLTRTGDTFSGVQVGSGRVTCNAAGQTLVDTDVSGETIVNGQISGSQLTFRLGSIPGQNTATISGTSMTGTAQWVLTQGNASVTLNGQFTAAKV